MANKKRKDRSAGPKVARKPNPPGRPGNVADSKTTPGAQKGATTTGVTAKTAR
jgi:hypothetical protein